MNRRLLKVKSCDLLIAEVDLIGSVGIGWAKRYVQTVESFADKITLMMPINQTIFLNASDQLVRWIFNHREALGKRANADLIASCRHLHL